MIYTVTVNPALDYVVTLPHLTLGAVNHLTTTHTLPGGKGINGARILNALNLPATALGFLGGATGQAITQALEQLGLTSAFTPIAADTRINVKLKAESETELNAPGPVITEAEIAAFERQLASLLRPNDVVILAGSLPPSLPARFYQSLLPLIQATQAEFVIDTTGQGLLDTLVAHPLVVKPNHHELAALFHDAPYPDLEQTAAAGRRLLTRGAQHVLVSMAGAGALLLTPEATYHGTTVAKPVQNSVGAGDSMLAGFTGVLHQTGDALAAFKMGLACGSATAYSVDIADRQTIDAVLAGVTVTPL